MLSDQHCSSRPPWFPGKEVLFPFPRSGEPRTSRNKVRLSATLLGFKSNFERRLFVRKLIITYGLM